MKDLHRNKYFIALWFLILVYIAYFSIYTILRYRTLYSSYFDLGIMHQTVYNTYRAIATGNWSRVLELTNPYGPDQIKRMAIHNDLLLAPLAFLYFIYSGPETLLVVQTVASASGALALYLIAKKILQDKKWASRAALALAISYLLNPALQKANMFEFHAVVLATPLLLFMYYFWLTRRHAWSFVCMMVAILSKEQVGLTTMFFGLFAALATVWKEWRENKNFKQLKIRQFIFPLIFISTSLLWFLVSMLVIIPHYRGDNHFALSYYSDLGDSPLKILLGVVARPLTLFHLLVKHDAADYLLRIIGPTGFFALLSPAVLLVALPEWAVNLLSASNNMRNIYYHYTAVITPFVFIAAAYGVNRIAMRRPSWKKFIPAYIIASALLANYLLGPLPFTRNPEVHPFLYPQKQMDETQFWKKMLSDKRLRISTTGQLAPFFSSRRYFYTFSKNYPLADYLVLRLTEIYNYPEKDVLIPVYERLTKDPRFQLIYSQDDLVVYKKK